MCSLLLEQLLFLAYQLQLITTNATSYTLEKTAMSSADFPTVSSIFLYLFLEKYWSLIVLLLLLLVVHWPVVGS